MDQATTGPKNQNFGNPTGYIPLDQVFYAGNYSQKDFTLKSNCEKDISGSVLLYPRILFGAKMKIFKN